MKATYNFCMMNGEMYMCCGMCACCAAPIRNKLSVIIYEVKMR